MSSLVENKTADGVAAATGIAEYIEDKMGGAMEQTIPHMSGAAVDLENNPTSQERVSFTPANQEEFNLQTMIKDETITIYHKVDDPVYDEFKENIRLRDEFKNHIKEIQLNDRVKIWRTLRDVEADTKERMAKIATREKAKKQRAHRWVTCQCFRKNPISAEQKQLIWLKDRNTRIKRQRNNADDNYMYMDQKPSS